MSDYSKTTNFTAKDALSSGDPNKVIKGSEHDTEYDNIETASATKANKIVSAVTNDLILQSATGDLAAAGFGMPNVNADITSSDEELNILDGATLTTAELNYVDGVTSDIQTQIDAKADLASPTFTGNPTAPTPSAGDDDTSIATTAFVTDVAEGAASASRISPLALASWGGTGLGDGSDGALTYATNTTLSSGLYQATSLDIQSGVTVDVTGTSQWLIFLVQGTATIDGTVDMDTNGGPGRAGRSTEGNGQGGTFGIIGGAGGGGGGTTSNNDGGKGGAGLLWVTGGNGGTSSGTGSAGEAATTDDAHEFFKACGLSSVVSPASTYNFTGGGGGGSGGRQISGTSGSGGNGGGGLIIFANEIVFTGTITCDGGNGSSGSGVSGGGGGGAGGCALLLCRTLTTNTGSITVTGGSGGSGSSGGAGGTGGAGLSFVSALPL